MSRLVRPKNTPQIQLPSNFLGIPKKPLWAPAEPKPRKQPVDSNIENPLLEKQKSKKAKNPTKKKKPPKKKKRETRFYLSETDFTALRAKLEKIVHKYENNSKNKPEKKEYMNQLWKDFLAYEKEWNNFLKKFIL